MKCGEGALEILKYIYVVDKWATIDVRDMYRIAECSIYEKTYVLTETSRYMQIANI